MIHSIRYSVTFPTTGRTLAENITFRQGLGAIVGPNEAGKSFVVEMIRYALFGSAALRGKAEDYRNLNVEMNLTIRQLDYRIVRSPKTTDIFRGTDHLATGVKPVNAKVIEVLGYDLTVFDISNVANQGDIERLLTMRPTERKQMIDRVIGLDRLDELSTWAGQEALGLAREASALASTNFCPDPPHTPKHTDVDGLKAKVIRFNELDGELHTLKGFTHTKPVAPSEPVDEYPGVSLEHAKAKAEEQQALVREVRRLEGLPLPSDYTNEQLEAMLAQHDAFDAWRTKQAFLAQRPKPTMLYSEVLEAFEAHRLEEHRAGLTRQLETAKASGTARCPCGQDFELEHHTIIKLEETLRALPAPKPLLDIAVLKREEARHKDWNSSETNSKWRQLESIEQVEAPRLPRAVIAQELRKNSEAADQSVLRSLREQLAEEPIDWPTVFEAKRSFASKTEVYDQLKAKYDQNIKTYDAAIARINELVEAIKPLEGVRDHLMEAQAYAVQMEGYCKGLQRYEETKARIESLRQREAGFRACKAAITAVRSKVKAYIIPALNNVASHLISEMTGGQRQRIEIDNDFDNIIVDGQSIDTLSGSGKACASLAIRIGLGQVLTNNVLSIFIGDEIDASMDQNRADNVAELLVNLQTRILQRLLVTHKSPVADYTVRIGDKLNVAA